MLGVLLMPTQVRPNVGDAPYANIGETECWVQLTACVGVQKKIITSVHPGDARETEDHELT